MMDLIFFNEKLKKGLEGVDYEEGTTYLRKLLDKVTVDLINLFFKRMLIVSYVGKLKKKYKKPLVVKSREEEIMRKIDELVNEKNMKLQQAGIKFNPEVAKKIMRILINYALSVEK